MTTLEARVRALECAVYGTAFRTTDKDLFNDTVSRLDLTTLEASLRAEMAVLKSSVAARPSRTAWDYDAALFRYRTEAQMAALERRFRDFERLARENRDAAVPKEPNVEGQEETAADRQASAPGE